MGKQKYNKGKTSGEVCQEGLHTGIEPGWEIREWCSDYIKGSCVIWRGNINFLNLVTGNVDLKVTGIWEGSDYWKQQTRRWWLDTK